MNGKRYPADRNEIAALIYNTGLMPLFYHSDLVLAKKLLSISYEAGLRVIEFTNRAAFAFDVFKELSIHTKKNHPEMRLGVGTVIDAGTAAMYFQVGADFIVMPSLQEDVIIQCNKRKILCIPGCGSVTEISHAERLGCEFVKLFPGAHFGPGFVKDILGPLPWASIVVSGGVEPTEQSIKVWTQSGASCLAVGSKLFTPAVLKGENNEELFTLTQNCLRWVQEARGN